MGDAVAGPMCCVTGAITMTTAVTNLSKSRFTANIGSIVMGVAPLGFPVSVAVLICPNVNEIV
jgi:hypothetical protein